MKRMLWRGWFWCPWWHGGMWLWDPGLVSLRLLLPEYACTLWRYLPVEEDLLSKFVSTTAFVGLTRHLRVSKRFKTLTMEKQPLIFFENTAQTYQFRNPEDGLRIEFIMRWRNGSKERLFKIRYSLLTPPITQVELGSGYHQNSQVRWQSLCTTSPVVRSQRTRVTSLSID